MVALLLTEKKKNWPQSGKNREMVTLPPVLQATELHAAVHGYGPTHELTRASSAQSGTSAFNALLAIGTAPVRSRHSFLCSE